MSFLEFLFGSLYLVAALVVVLGLILALPLYSALAKRMPVWFPGTFMVVLAGLGLALIPVLSDRHISVANEIAGASLEGGRTIVDIWITRTITLGLLLVAGGEIWRNWRPSALSGNEKTLWLAYMGFVLMSGLVPAILGTHPTFIHSMIYAPLILTAFYMMKGYNPDQFLRHMRLVIGAILVLSLVAAVIRPSLAIEQPYSGFLPGVNFRLWGVVSHPNILGPISALYLILLVRERVLGCRLILHVLLGLLTLILAQSKTAWVAALVVFGFFFARCYISKLGRALSGRATSPSRTGAVIGMMSIMSFSLIILFAFVFLDPALWLDDLLSTRLGGRLSTLTGRTNIWQLTLAEWEKSPIFGYGPELWSIEYRTQKGLLYAGQAHNQFIHTLGESGLFGMLGLLTYTIVLLKTALRYSSATQGVSLALFLLILVRTVSETPFRNYYVFEAAFLMHMALFGYLILLSKAEADAKKNIRVADGRTTLLGTT